MAKKSKGSTKSHKRGLGARRRERRFLPQSSVNGTVVRALGALSALLLGAGAWAYMYGKSFADDEKLRALPSYLVAGGAVVLGITIWIGTSSEPPVRVGDPGIALEKGELRRMPWWSVERMTFEAGSLALVIAGKDEVGVSWTFKVSVSQNPDAVGWLVKEALDRIPRKVDIADETLEKLPSAGESAGETIDLEPLQIVGKRCSVTGKTISYEPEGRICPRCERVYLKTSIPKKCKCGNALRSANIEESTEAPEAEDEGEPQRSSGGRTAREPENSVASDETGSG
jgi:hypothetical protein